MRWLPGAEHAVRMSEYSQKCGGSYAWPVCINASCFKPLCSVECMLCRCCPSRNFRVNSHLQAVTVRPMDVCRHCNVVIGNAGVRCMCGLSYHLQCAEAASCQMGKEERGLLSCSHCAIVPAVMCPCQGGDCAIACHKHRSSNGMPHGSHDRSTSCSSMGPAVTRPGMHMGQGTCLPISQLQLTAAGQLTPVCVAAAPVVLFLGPVALVPLLQPRLLLCRPAAAPMHTSTGIHLSRFASERLQERSKYKNNSRTDQYSQAQQQWALAQAAAAAAKEARACAHGRPAGAARSEVGGLSAEFIQRCNMELQKWQAFEDGLVGKMRACGWCGKVAFGGNCSMLWKHMSLRQCTEIPPAVAANPGVMYTSAEAAHSNKGLASPCPGKYYCCQTCQRPAAQASRRQYHVRTSAADMRAMQTLYQLNAGLPLMLGVIKCGVRIASRMSGFLVAEPTSQLPLVDGPLITYDHQSGYSATEMADLVNLALQQQKDLGNPVIQQYKTVLERAADAHAQQQTDPGLRLAAPQESVPAPSCTGSVSIDGSDSDTASSAHSSNSSQCSADCQDTDSTADRTAVPQHAVPVLPGNVASRILQRAQQRNTTAACVEDTQARLGMAAVVHTGSLMGQEELAAARKRKSNPAYFAGELQRRGMTVKRLMCTATGLTAVANLTVELAIFPFLFPTGQGYFDGGITFSEYLKMRSMQLFSRFTLVREYLLVMIQVYMVHHMLSAVSESALEEAIQRIKEDSPSLPDKEVFRRVVKKLAPASIVGSPGYYRRNLHDLLVYAAKHGMPHLFVTLTADELSECRWSCVRDLEQFVENKLLPGMTWQDLPIECARLFHDRMMHLLHEHILCEGGGIFGRVTGYMVRYESQGRGSLHAHILFWLHPDDVEEVCNQITASLPCCYEMVHMNGGDAVYQPVEPPEDDGSIVAQLCRIVKRKQKHACDDSEYGCVQDNGQCCEGYPYAPNRAGTVYDDRRGLYKYLRMGPADSRIVPYHPLLLLLWNGGCNVQRVTNCAWSKYVLKYAAKAEPTGSLDIDTNTAAQLGIFGVSKQRIRFASAAVLSKAVTPSETACIAAGIPIIQTSYSVTYVDVTPPAKRRAYLGRGGSIAPSHVTLYMNRPTLCKDLFFEEYFAKHMVVGHGSKVQRPQGATADPPVLDQLGNSVFTCEEPRLVRLTDFHPVYQSEAFFYKHLLCSRLWVSEEELKPCDGSWFNECVRQGVVSSMADVDGAIEGYGAFHMHDTVLIEQLRDMFMQQQDLSFLWGAVSEPTRADADVQQEQVDAFHTLKEMIGWTGDLREEGQQGSGDAVVDAAAAAAADAEAAARSGGDDGGGGVTGAPALSLRDLNNKQRAFVDEVLRIVQEPQRAAYNYRMPRVVFLRGGPGTGKTATLQVLLSLLDANAVSMLVGATTAAAAQRLNRPGQADTIDALLGLWVGREFGMLPVDSQLRAALEAARVCICDEFSMLTFDKLMYIKHRMRMATRAGQPVKVLILSGDEQQLPPVCRHKINSNLGFCKKCHVCTTPDWQEALHFELEEVYRQASDQPLLHFLNNCRKTTPTPGNIDYILGGCCWPEESFEQLLCEGVTVLCTHVDLVKDSNDRALRWHMEHGLLGSDVYSVQADTDAWMDPEMSSWVAKHHLLTSVAVGAPVVFNFNTAKSMGCVNSARGVVMAVHTDGGGENVEALTVRLEGTGREVIVKRSIVNRKWHNGHSFFLKTFPLQLAYAVTAHKSQGLTLTGRVVLRIKDCFAAGMLYVMLSRVTDRRNLRILGALEPKMFRRFDF